MNLLTPFALGVSTMTALCLAELVDPFFPNASEGAYKNQPSIDFDTDSCYHVAAISPSSTLNAGLPPRSGVSECHNEDRLHYSNAYVREKCNADWCVYLYAYYAEVDATIWMGHTHDWEHIVVWTRHGWPQFISWSHHGGHTTEDWWNVRWDGNFHPKFVYHLGGGGTHSLRLAEEKDDAVENAWGIWFRAWLVDVQRLDEGIQRDLKTNDWGSAHPAFADGDFEERLDDWMPDLTRDEGFDAWA